MYVDIKDFDKLPEEERAKEIERAFKDLVFKLNRELDEIKKIIEELKKNGEEE